MCACVRVLERGNIKDEGADSLFSFTLPKQEGAMKETKGSKPSPSFLHKSREHTHS